MQSTEVFEAFNHFLSTRDAGQLLSFADDVEVFGSSTFDEGRTYIGQVAPAKFRETISIMRLAKQPMSAEFVHAIIGDNSATFFVNVTKGRKVTGSAINIVIANGKLKSFYESSTKL